LFNVGLLMVMRICISEMYYITLKKLVN